MCVLSVNGNVLVSHENYALTLFKPRNAWGYTVSKRDDIEDIYRLMYEELKKPFIRGESRDGGITNTTYGDENLHKLIIPIDSLNLQDTHENRINVIRAEYYAAKDNPNLNCTDLIGDMDSDYDDADFATDSGILESVTVSCCILEPKRE